MKKLLFQVFFLICACVTITSSCITEERPAVVLAAPIDKRQTVYADQTTGGDITFLTKDSWMIDVKRPTGTASVDWLDLTLDGVRTYEGEAGTVTLATELLPNYTGEDRRAIIFVICAGIKDSLVVEQKSITLAGKPLEPSVNVAAQNGEVKAGVAGSVTFTVRSKGIPDGSRGTVRWFTNAAGTTASGQSPTGISASLSEVENDEATLTVTTTEETVQGTYYFRTTTNDVVSPMATLAIGAPQQLVFEDRPTFDIPAMPTGSYIGVINVSTAVSGGKPPYIYSATGLPAGISIDSSTGLISGVPTTQSSAGTATITVMDSSLTNPQSRRITINYGAVSLTYYISVTSPINFADLFLGYAPPVAQAVMITNTGSGDITLSQPEATNFIVGKLSNNILAAREAVAFTIQPKPGLEIGTYTETIIIGSNASTSTSVVANVTVIPAPLVFTDDDAYNIPPLRVGTAMSEINLSAAVSGGTLPYVFSATNLPSGITINHLTGVISGIPISSANAGEATITVKDTSSPEQQSQIITIAYGAVTP